MRWQYDQRLVETAMFDELRRLDAQGQTAPLSAYRRDLDACYDIAEGASRDRAFFDAHWRRFVALGFDRMLSEALARYPRIGERVPEGVVVHAPTQRAEGAELFQRDGELTTMAIRVHPDRFADRAGLAAFYRHELCHIEDLLDPDFGYQQADFQVTDGPVEARLMRERYRVLWATSIDGRLAQAGLPSLMSLPQRRNEWRRVFSCVGTAAAEAWCERLWHQPAMRHAQLLEMARQPRVAMAAEGRSDAPAWDEPHAREGLPCPLCQFVSHVWVRAEILPEAALAQIQSEFPSWPPSAGLCGRCAEVYTALSQAHAAAGSGC